MTPWYVCFVGDSFAPRILREAAERKGLRVTDDPLKAHLVFLSQDTPTASDGGRDLAFVERMVRANFARGRVNVLTSQVPPGFTRGLGLPLYYQAETLRIKDALSRALSPEMHIIGCGDPMLELPWPYLEYLRVFDCPILRMTLEEAELAKIAINYCLARQVDATNVLVTVAEKYACRWSVIKEVLQHDKRIGPHAYLDAGDWRMSPHLVRDHATVIAAFSKARSKNGT